MSPLVVGALAVFMAVLVALVVARSRRKSKLVTKAQLRPETARAIDQGTMSNDQMVELLRATGWDARVENGRIVVPKKD